MRAQIGLSVDLSWWWLIARLGLTCLPITMAEPALGWRPRDRRFEDGPDAVGNVNA